VGSLTKKTYGILLTLLVSGLALPACTVSKVYPPAADHAAIGELRRQIQEAENAGDASVFERVAAADVVVMPPKAGVLLGRDATVRIMREFFEKTAMHIEYSKSVVEVHPDSAIERGLFSQTLTPKDGGPAVSSRGSYLWVYRRTNSGGWEMSHAIWNMN